MSRFTEPQQQALEKAYELLSEQFNGALIVVVADVDSVGAEPMQECVRTFYSGGRTLALGLATDAQHSLLCLPPTTSNLEP